MVAAALLAVVALAPAPVFAHCDRMDGPVVTAAERALESGNVDLVLIWVPKADEPEIRRAFERTVAVRQLSAPAKELADRYFFETLVRVHRAGEGAPFTGLKPAGVELEPAVAAADAALRDGRVDRVTTLLRERVEHGVRERFTAVVAKKDYAANDVEAGREYVRAYVPFVHYVAGIYAATESAAHGHDTPAEAAHPASAEAAHRAPAEAAHPRHE
jgi:hypothetical protein